MLLTIMPFHNFLTDLVRQQDVVLDVLSFIAESLLTWLQS